MADRDAKFLDDINALAYRKFGLHIAKEKYETFIPKIEKLIMREGFENLERLHARLMAGDQAVLETLVRYITTAHTYFFRESDHFDTVIRRIREEPREENLIWCTACSTGEEPYSLALSLVEAGIRNFKILASDINSAVLAAFNKGEYHLNRLASCPPGVLLKRFALMPSGRYRIDPVLRGFISIKKLNIMEPHAFERPFDFVFCRNVLIYFNEESRRRALSNLGSAMRRGALLFLGHTETILGDSPGFRRAGSSVYERTAGAREEG